MKKSISSPHSSTRTVSAAPVLGKKLLACAMSTLLVTTSVMPSVAYADQSSDSTSSDTETSPSIDASSTSKKETVYSKADASGKTSGIYVVNYFNTTAATDVSDPGSYTELTNMSSSEDLTDTDGKVNLTTLAGEPFYYQEISTARRSCHGMSRLPTPLTESRSVLTSSPAKTVTLT